MVEALDEAALPALPGLFHDRVRRDAELGPVFDSAVHNWPAYLQRLAAFWSSVMLTSGRYKGNPMLMHLKHGDSITVSMFARWLAIWHETTDELLPAKTASAMHAKAQRIAQAQYFQADGTTQPVHPDASRSYRRELLGDDYLHTVLRAIVALHYG